MVQCYSQLQGVLISKILDEFNAMPKRTATLNGKVILPEEMIEALRYIEKNTDANKSLILEQALEKFGIIQKAKSLKKELESMADPQTKV